MALTFAAGGRTFTLSRCGIEHHPGSLMHSLVSSVGSEDGPVTLSVDSLPDSPFSAWPAAIEVTIALYKREPLAAATLSDLLKTHTEHDLYNRLQALMDFLNISGGVQQLLPAMASIPLRHMGVLKLWHDAHWQAHKAVDIMMDSTAFTTLSKRPVSAAVFFVGALDISSTASGYDVVCML